MTVSVDAVVYSRVVDPVEKFVWKDPGKSSVVSFQVASVTRVSNVNAATQLLSQTTLRNILGTKSLQEILTDREQIAHSMQSHLDEGTDPWGVKVERVEM